MCAGTASGNAHRSHSNIAFPVLGGGFRSRGLGNAFVSVCTRLRIYEVNHVHPSHQGTPSGKSTTAFAHSTLIRYNHTFLTIYNGAGLRAKQRSSSPVEIPLTSRWPSKCQLQPANVLLRDVLWLGPMPWKYNLLSFQSTAKISGRGASANSGTPGPIMSVPHCG